MPVLNITAADHTAGTLTITAHNLITGGGFIGNPNGPSAAALFAAPGSGGVIPTGLAPVTSYWPIVVDPNTIKLATSNALAMAGTAVTFADNGTMPLQYLVGLPYRRPRTMAVGAQLASDDLNAGWDAQVALWNFLTGQAQSVFRRRVKRGFYPIQISTGVGGSSAWTPAANPAQPGSALTAVLKAPAGFSGIASLFAVPYEIGEQPIALSVWIYGDGSSGAGTLSVRMGYAPNPGTLPVNLGIFTATSIPVGWNLYTVTNTVQVIPDSGMLTAELVFVAGSANVYIAEMYLDAVR